MTDLPTLTSGQRIKIYRNRAGMSRPVLAGLVGRSPEWLKQVETGRLLTPRLAMLNQVAKALGVPMRELLDGDQVPAANLSGPKLSSLDQMREALNYRVRHDPLTLDQLRSEVDEAWHLRDTALHHRDAIVSIPS